MVITVIINLLCLVFSSWMSWKFVRDRLGIKKLGVMCSGVFLFMGLTFLCAKYFDIGFALIPTRTALLEPENSMLVAQVFLKALLLIFPICYLIEFIYYRIHPDLDPYAKKKKFLETEEGNEIKNENSRKNQ